MIFGRSETPELVGTEEWQLLFLPFRAKALALTSSRFTSGERWHLVKGSILDPT
jgi:hypothetical protein